MDYRIFNVRTDVTACSCTQGVYGHCKKSLHWKLTLEEKSLAAPANQTCLSSVPVWCSTNWATSQPQQYKSETPGSHNWQLSVMGDEEEGTKDRRWRRGRWQWATGQAHPRLQFQPGMVDCYAESIQKIDSGNHSQTPPQKKKHQTITLVTLPLLMSWVTSWNKQSQLWSVSSVPRFRMTATVWRICSLT